MRVVRTGHHTIVQIAQLTGPDLQYPLQTDTHHRLELTALRAGLVYLVVGQRLNHQVLFLPARVQSDLLQVVARQGLPQDDQAPVAVAGRAAQVAERVAEGNRKMFY